VRHRGLNDEYRDNTDKSAPRIRQYARKPARRQPPLSPGVARMQECRGVISDNHRYMSVRVFDREDRVEAAERVETANRRPLAPRSGSKHRSVRKPHLPRLETKKLRQLTGYSAAARVCQCVRLFVKSAQKKSLKPKSRRHASVDCLGKRSNRLNVRSLTSRPVTSSSIAISSMSRPKLMHCRRHPERALTRSYGNRRSSTRVGFRITLCGARRWVLLDAFLNAFIV
jgi:hypothetical protein